MKEMEHKLGALDDVAIEPIAPEHINSFHRGLDLVARERQHLDISDAGPLAHFRDYIKKQISITVTRSSSLLRRAKSWDGAILNDIDSRRMSILERSISRSFLDSEIVVSVFGSFRRP